MSRKGGISTHGSLGVGGDCSAGSCAIVLTPMLPSGHGNLGGLGGSSSAECAVGMIDSRLSCAARSVNSQLVRVQCYSNSGPQHESPSDFAT
jgi:hypothetical protein